MTQSPPSQGPHGDTGPTTGSPAARSNTRWFRAGLLAVLLIVAGVVFWKAAIAPNLFPRNFGIVEDGKIYRSGRLTAAALERLYHKRHIKTIIDFGGYDPGSELDRREQRTAEALGIKRYVLRLEGDGTGNPNNYVQALRLMNDPENQPVLVHCSAGTQRTGCAVVLYRHIVQHRLVSDAFVESKKYDHKWADNPWMMIMIAEYGDEIAKAYREGGWVPGQAAADTLAVNEKAPEGGRTDRSAGSDEKPRSSSDPKTELTSTAPAVPEPK